MTRIGRYEIERRLGGGGMAEVFLAHLIGNEGFSRPVAIKRVLPHFAADPAFVHMFVSEAQLCAKLQHPNIVSVLDFDRDEDGRPYLVLELVDGVTLAELASPLSSPVAIHVGIEILRALAYAHDLPIGETRGIVHRDISPHNVLVSKEGAVKLADFGIAKARTSTSATASEVLKGKPSYMSPEQANGEALDGRSDLFATGIVLWELLVGRPLFSGQTTEEMLSRVLFASIPSPRSLRPEVPADLDRAVMHLLQREPDDRPPTATASIDELVTCKDAPRNGRELLVGALAATTSMPLGQASTMRSPAALPRPRGRRRSPRTWLYAASGLVLLALSIVLLSAVRREKSSTARDTPVLPQDEYMDFQIPNGWTVTSRGKQARLVPSGHESSGIAIIVSRLLARQPNLPGPVTVFEKALEYELRTTNATLLAKNGPYPITTEYGLSGFYHEVRLTRATGIERRLYLALFDDYWQYGLGFTASDELFEKYSIDFWTAARSIRPEPPRRGQQKVDRPQALFGQ